MLKIDKQPRFSNVCRIFLGEGDISPETGIFYPWVTDVIAKELKAYVVEPEHRFYGESLPFGPDRSYQVGSSLTHNLEPLPHITSFKRPE